MTSDCDIPHRRTIMQGHHVGGMVKPPFSPVSTPLPTSYDPDYHVIDLLHPMQHMVHPLRHMVYLTTPGYLVFTSFATGQYPHPIPCTQCTYGRTSLFVSCPPSVSPPCQVAALRLKLLSSPACSICTSTIAPLDDHRSSILSFLNGLQS